MRNEPQQKQATLRKYWDSYSNKLNDSLPIRQYEPYHLRGEFVNSNIYNDMRGFVGVRSSPQPTFFQYGGA